MKAQVDLFEQGFMILQPLTEHAPFDLVAYRGGRFVRIQVKYRSLDRTGKLEVKFWASWADRNGTHSVPVDKNEVDVFCVYCPDTDECYYLDPDQFGYSACLRVKATKNRQSRGVRFASDFRRVP